MKEFFSNKTKTLIPLLLSCFLTAMLMSPVASASSKSTSQCSMKGQTKVSSGKKYTCIQQGKKLIWNKGVQILKPKPVVTETQKTQAWIGGYHDIFSQLNSGKAEGLILPIYSPNVDKNRAKIIVGNFTESISLYKNIMGSISPIYLVFVSEVDESFYRDQVVGIEGALADSNFFQNTHCPVNKFNYCAYGSNKVSQKIVFYQFLGSEMSSDLASARISNYHESVHMYQQSLTPENMYSFMPPWFIEGQATFLGNVSILKFSSSSDVANLRTSQIKGFLDWLPKSTVLNSKNMIELFNLSEIDLEFVTKNSLGYNLGMLMSEYMYLKFGVSSMNNLMLKGYETHDWEDSLSKALGLSKSRLYEDMSHYVLTQLEEINR